MKLVEHKLGQNIEIVRILGKVNKKVRSQGILFKYKTQDKPDKIQDYRCSSFQTVTEVCVGVGNVSSNVVIMRCKEGCLHPIVAFGLCTECGKDLKNDEDLTNTENSVSMLHAIPQVKLGAISSYHVSLIHLVLCLINLPILLIFLVLDLDF